MSDLYERLQAWLDEFERDVAQPEPLLSAVRAVLELHKPIDCTYPVCRDKPHCVCQACGSVEAIWPCPTVRAIARALDVPIEGDQQ